MTTTNESPQEAQRRYKRYLEAEREAIAVYSAMRAAERDPRRAMVLEELIAAERRHAERWAGKLGIPPHAVPGQRKTWRSRMLGFMSTTLGTDRALKVAERLEGKDTEMYGGDPEAVDIMQEEIGHSEKLRELRNGHPSPSAEIGGRAWESAASSGAFRAGVLGANDGLVSNFGLVWGVAGGTSDPQIILLAGVAGLLAGAFSMAAGEYVSMRADRDLAEFRIEKERRELEEFPEEEQEELSLLYQMKGLTKEEADRLAERAMEDKTIALDTKIREELGLDPNGLGSPWGASISSFIAFSMGAIVPLSPYLASSGQGAFIASGVLSGLALMLVGGALAALSGKNPLWAALRMLAIGVAAAALTNSIGRMVGVALK